MPYIRMGHRQPVSEQAYPLRNMKIPKEKRAKPLKASCAVFGNHRAWPAFRKKPSTLPDPCERLQIKPATHTQAIEGNDA